MGLADASGKVPAARRPAPVAQDSAEAARPAPADPAVRRRAELREFLISRRARISPQQAGLPAGGGRRRTPGLRREEVAVLAGVGVSWYQWLEQGRAISVSGQVLDAVGRVLELDDAERRHLYALAGLNPPAPAAPDGCPGCGAESLNRLIEAWMPSPAQIMDTHWNNLAVNTAARLVFGLAAEAQNCLASLFLDGAVSRWIVNRDEVAAGAVANFRAEMTSRPQDARFQQVVDDLRARSAWFAALWERRDVAAVGTVVKVLDHPEAGLVRFESTQLEVPQWPGLRIVLHNPVDAETRSRLARLVGEHERRRGLHVA